MLKKTQLMQTEISEGRCVTAHFMQVIYDDDGSEIARSKPHSVSFMPDADHDEILAKVNADITTRSGMKWQPIESAEWARAVSHCEIEHTPEVKVAYAKYVAQQQENVEPRE